MNQRATWLLFLALFVTGLVMGGCFDANRRLVRPDIARDVPDAPSFFSYELTSLRGEPVALEQYRGHYVLVVNTASRCGYTSQYQDLQRFHETFGGRVAVLGFPANDFMSQEPGSNEEIATVCYDNYGVTFPMFAKIVVSGKGRHPLYQWLSDPALNGWNQQQPVWNFSKYLIGPDGKLLGFYGPGFDPFSPEILNVIGDEPSPPKTHDGVARGRSRSL